MPSSPEELARRCNVVLICVSADHDLLQVIRLLLPGLVARSVVVDASTVNPSTAIAAAEMLAEIGVHFVDAPVSGGVEGAINGRLSVMAGGKSADILRLPLATGELVGEIGENGLIYNGCKNE